LNARSFGLQTGSFQERHDVAVELRVSVEENIAMGWPLEMLRALAAGPNRQSGTGSR
jgi:hypothetical protein